MLIKLVALFTRAWIEISLSSGIILAPSVALFTRAWIEIDGVYIAVIVRLSRPLHEGVD